MDQKLKDVLKQNGLYKTSKMKDLKHSICRNTNNFVLDGDSIAAELSKNLGIATLSSCDAIYCQKDKLEEKIKEEIIPKLEQKILDTASLFFIFLSLCFDDKKQRNEILKNSFKGNYKFIFFFIVDDPGLQSIEKFFNEDISLSPGFRKLKKKYKFLQDLSVTYEKDLLENLFLKPKLSLNST